MNLRSLIYGYNGMFFLKDDENSDILENIKKYNTHFNIADLANLYKNSLNFIRIHSDTDKKYISIITDLINQHTDGNIRTRNQRDR